MLLRNLTHLKFALFSVLCISVSFNASSQIKFEKGYYIKLDNQRIECLIKDREWKNNPDEFEYKLSEGDDTHKESVSTVKEFGILSRSRYVSAEVMIDRTGEYVATLDTEKNPMWLRERLFLEVLIEGNASLLYFTTGNLRRYFYQVDDTIKQLVSRKYLDEKNEVKVNQAFRQQLWSDVRCGSTTEADVKTLDYTKNDLIKYFRSYLECTNAEMVDYTKHARRGAFHLKLTPGMNYSTLKVLYSENPKYKNYDVDYESQVDFRMGLEAEFVLPYNKNKWSIVVEPNYQTFSSTNEAGTKFAKYNSFEIPLGFRYYIFLKEKSRIFVNGLFVYGIPSNSSSIQIMDFNFPISQRGGFAIGAGFDYRKFSGEIRYFRSGDLLDEYVKFTAPHNRLSFILGYRLF